MPSNARLIWHVDGTKGDIWMATGTRRASFGNVRKLPSGRFQARYTGPDGRNHNAPMTFETRRDAQTYLSTVRADIVRGSWQADQDNPRQGITLDQYATNWIATRKVKGRPIADRTREHYTKLHTKFLSPTLGKLPLKAITADVVMDWYDSAAPGTPTYKAHAYSLLRAIMTTAADPTKNNGRPLIPYNPCGITGGGSTERARHVRPATLDELATIVQSMPERYRAMVLLACWCSLRFGELAELRRNDVDIKRAVIKVRRGVVRAGGEVIVKKPKSDAGTREVAIPPHILPAVREHLLEHTQPGKDGLLFPSAGGGHMAPSSLYRVFYRARETAGRPDLRFHDLRGTGATLAARAGATTAELMARLGHTTTEAAMRYQHAAQERDKEIARKLSEMAGGAE